MRLTLRLALCVCLGSVAIRAESGGGKWSDAKFTLELTTERDKVMGTVHESGLEPHNISSGTMQNRLVIATSVVLLLLLGAFVTLFVSRRSSHVEVKGHVYEEF